MKKQGERVNNPSKPILLGALIVEGLLIVIGLLAPYTGFLWWLEAPPIELGLRLATLALFAVSLAFRDWWVRTASAGIVTAVTSIVLRLSEGFIHPTKGFVDVVLMGSPVLLAALAILLSRRADTRLRADSPNMSDEELKELKRERKAAQKSEARARDFEMKKMCGPVVVDEFFALKSVKIYRNGYVRVSGAMGATRLLSSQPPEKLIGIRSSADVSKKSGLGRAAGAALTGGANLVLSPNQRGDVYLTIVTEKKTHQLHASPPTGADLKAMHKIAATGQAILDGLQGNVDALSGQNAIGADSPTTTKIVDDLPAQLQQLADLHASGTLTDIQFEAAKDKLLAGG
jgi:hypothetical protein